MMQRITINSTCSRIHTDISALLTDYIGNWLMYTQYCEMKEEMYASEECKPVPLRCNKESGAERAISMRTRR